MFKFINDKLSIKVLTVLGVILAISFTGLCFTIQLRQGFLLEKMGEEVNAKLKETSVIAEQEFQRLENDVSQSLTDMGQKVADKILTDTETALVNEEGNVTTGMEKLLKSNAHGVASLIASVGSDSIMSKDYDTLINLSKAGSKSEEILFILFLGKDDEPLPSYLNRVDDYMVSYLENFEFDENNELDEEHQETLTVLEKSKSDPNVYVHELQIDYYNLKVGTIVVGITRKTITEEISAMSGRFDTLKKDNEKTIRDVLASESASVIDQIENNLNTVQKGNIQALSQTGAILEDSSQEVNINTTNVVMIVGTLCGVIILLLFGILLNFMIIRPLSGITEGLRDAAEGEGDLTKRLNSTRTDEIGIVASWFDAFVQRLNNIIVEIGGNSETVTSSALEVLSASDSLKNESVNLSLKANTVATASEEMNTSMSSVAAASEQASTNISLVAETAIEMKDTLEGVVVKCDKAMEVSHTATGQVQIASENVGLLGDAANEISKVTEVITEIADQTNLLALNATIEAARAGEAGKGFSVVAGEIKSLAQQTQEATQEIKTKIAGIQNSTTGTINEVGKINQVINDVDSIVSSIAESMSEQSEKAAEVAMNIEQASQGISEVNENVAQSSQVSAEIARDMGEVSNISQEMNNRSDVMRSNSEDLSKLSSELRNMISVFKVSFNDQKSKRIETAGESELFPWTNHLTIGINEIDNQHKQLVSLVNQLHRAMKAKAGATESGKILEKLAQYTVSHFAYEEKLFAEHNYPDSENHKKHHQALVEKVTRFQKDFASGKAGLSMDLMNFLTDWLKNHIMETDQAYAPFLQEKGL